MAYESYKYEPCQIVYVWGLNEWYRAKIISAYTSDTENHPAFPHKRYVILYPNGCVDDVSEIEIASVDEVDFTTDEVVHLKFDKERFAEYIAKEFNT